MNVPLSPFLGGQESPLLQRWGGSKIPQMTLNPGDVAPVFSLPDAAGQLVGLADFRGRRVVLYFYPRDNTPGCTKEASAFRE